MAENLSKKDKNENSSTVSEQTKNSACDTNSKSISSNSGSFLTPESDAALVVEVTTSLGNKPKDYSGHSKEQRFVAMNP